MSGQHKLIQDLKNWLLEPRGTDPMHPDYGSTLDGGTLTDGTFAASAIGGLITGEQLMIIEGELRRVLNEYQRQQVDRINREIILYAGKNTYSTGELLASIEDISLTQIQTTVVARITLKTANGDSLAFTQAVS